MTKRAKPASTTTSEVLTERQIHADDRAFLWMVFLFFVVAPGTCGTIDCVSTMRTTEVCTEACGPGRVAQVTEKLCECK